MIETLIYLLILCLVIGVLYWATTLFPLPHPFPIIIKVVFALIVLIIVVNILLGLAGGGAGRFPLYR